MSLPRGTVTLLFSDVEGSTQLQHRLGDRYQDVVRIHRRLLETAFAAHAGTVVDRQTESFFCVFPRAQDAVGAAAAVQRALADQKWPDGAEVRVRMGIHAGEPELADDRYVGLAVARAARICAAAHGGQVLLSSSARALVAERQQGSLRTLGFYKLKDFSEPEQLSQLVVDGLPVRFPPPRTEAPRSRRRIALLVAALLVIAAVGVLVLALATRGSSGAAHVGPTAIGVVDAKSSKVAGSIPLGFKSSLIAAGAGAIWAVDPKGSTLTKIDAETMKKSAPSSIGALGTIPTGISVGAGVIWVGAILSDGRQLGVLELEPQFGTLKRKIVLERSPRALTFTPLVNGVAVSADARGVWVLEQGLGKVRHIAARTGTPTAGVEGLDALSIATGPDGVWLGGRSGVTRVDPTTGAVVASTAVAGVAPSQSTSIAVGGGSVWFAGTAQSTLFQISPSDNAVTSTVTVGAGPSGVAVGDGAVWIANSRDGTVTRVDLRDSSTNTIRFGASPGGVVTYGGRAWTSPGLPQT